MAVTGSDRVALRHFARLKLRMIANSLAGGTVTAVLFATGAVVGMVLGIGGFALLAASTAADAPTRLLVASLTGAALVLGSALLPLVWFGVDDTLDPARFALLPLSRVRLVLGLLTAALLSVPALALLVVTAGLLVPAAAHGGLPAAAGQALGLLLGLLLCVAMSRAVTSAFATVLRSRRFRDLAGVILAVIAVLIGPLQLAIISGAQRADWQQLTAIAGVIGWTPLGAPYTVGAALAEGRPLAALGKLLISAATVALLLWWWSRTLESAMVGVASSGPAKLTRTGRASPIAQLLPRLVPGLPANAFGAIVAREIRYWWRDPKRRANVAMVLVIGVVVPSVMFAGGTGFFRLEVDGQEINPFITGPIATSGLMLFVGAFAATLLANQFGFDGTAYHMHLTTSVPGRLELRARAIGYAVLLAPPLLAAGALHAVASGDAAHAPAAWGMLCTGYGAGVAVSSHLSVVTAYPLPEGSNPMAIGSGGALAKSLLAMLSLILAFIIGAPVLAVAALLGAAWAWLALPIGLGYGVAVAALGCRFAGEILDRRGPELLATITPGR